MRSHGPDPLTRVQSTHPAVLRSPQGETLFWGSKPWTTAVGGGVRRRLATVTGRQLGSEFWGLVFFHLLEMKQENFYSEVQDGLRPAGRGRWREALKLITPPRSPAVHQCMTPEKQPRPVVVLHPLCLRHCSPELRLLLPCSDSTSQLVCVEDGCDASVTPHPHPNSALPPFKLL